MLKRVLKHEVFPALGCTEPIAVAYAASVAGKELGDDFEEMTIEVDAGVYKNGMAVNVPNIGGERGNLIAGVLGALKVVSATDSAIRSAYMALNDHGITAVEGFIGKNAEETIHNLSRIREIGMAKADDIMFDIMTEKTSSEPDIQ